MKLKFLLSCLALGVGIVSVLVGSGFSAFAFGGVDKVDGKVSTIAKTDVEYPTYTISRAWNINDAVFTNNGTMNQDTNGAAVFASGNGIGYTGGWYTGRARWNAFQEYLPSKMVKGTSKYFRIKVTDDKGNGLPEEALKKMDVELESKSNGLSISRANDTDSTLYKLTISDDAPNGEVSFTLKDKRLPPDKSKSDTFSFTLYDNQQDLLLHASVFRPLGSQGDHGLNHGKDGYGGHPHNWFNSGFSCQINGANGDAQNADPQGRNFKMKSDVNQAVYPAIVTSNQDISGKYYLKSSGSKEIAMSDAEVGLGNNGSEFQGGGSVNNATGGDWSTNINGGTIIFVNSYWEDENGKFLSYETEKNHMTFFFAIF